MEVARCVMQVFRNRFEWLVRGLLAKELVRARCEVDLAFGKLDIAVSIQIQWLSVTAPEGRVACSPWL